MNEKTTEQKSPIYILTEALAAMTIRAETAERERDAAKKDSDNWYDIFQKRDAEMKKLTEALAAEMADHQRTRCELDDALEKMQKMKKER